MENQFQTHDRGCKLYQDTLWPLIQKEIFKYTRRSDIVYLTPVVDVWG